MFSLIRASIVLAVVALFASCGSGGGGGYGSGGGGEPKPTGDPAFDAVLPVLSANCLSCHGEGNSKGLPSFASAAKFKGSKARARLQAGTMPPAPKTISASDRDALLAYLGG